MNGWPRRATPTKSTRIRIMRKLCRGGPPWPPVVSCFLILLTVVPAHFASVALFQDMGGTLAFQGQDIIGGAAVIFKAPQRVKDLVGGAATVMAVRRPPRSGRSSEVARNTNRPTATQPPATSTVATTDRTEEFKTQGNTYYDQGQFARALEAYQNAARQSPKDVEANASVGDAYLALGRFAEAAKAYEQTVRLEPTNAGALQQPRIRIRQTQQVGRVDHRVTKRCSLETRR